MGASTVKSSNRWGYLALVAVVANVLTSCGGGGGGSDANGGGGGGSGNVTFTANRTSLLFEYMEGTPLPPALEVVVTASGEFSGTLYLGAVVTGTGLSPTIPLTINSTTQGTFHVSAAGALPVGEYSGSLRLMACSDQACARQVGNSPLTLSYVTRVHPRLHVSSNQVALASQSNAGTMQDVAITLPWQATDFTTDVMSGSNFLTVSQPNPTTLRLTARAWPSGQHTASVRVNSGGQTELISITYTVTPPAGGEFDLRSNPTMLTLAAIERTSTSPTTITVSGPTWEPNLATETFVGYTAQSGNVQWLQVDPVAGGYRLTASAAQVNAGTFTANLVIRATDNSVPSTQLEIPVSFTVGEGLAQPADREVTLDANTTLQSPDLSASIPIALVAGPAVDWTAQSDRNWLTLTRASGQTGTDLNYVINPAMLDLANSRGPSDDVATVQITTTPFLTPRSFRVSLHQRLAHVRGISPYYQVQGRSSRHVVRGTGFIANRDWSQHLLVMGQPAGAGRVTRVNDTELVVDVDPGQVVIEVRNELSAVAGWDPIQVVAADSNVYQALATGFDLRKLLYDAQRQRLLVINQQPNDLDAFIYFAKTAPNAWQQGPSTLIPGLRDLMVANDNRTVWFVTTNGLRFAPMDTLTPSPASADQSFAPLHVPAANSAMVMTNDWRVWFGSENGLGIGNGVWYRDLLAANGLNVPLQSDLIQPREGPWFTVSGNGERLYISQASSITPAPSLLALDAKDGVLFEAAQWGDSTYLPPDAAINMDGSRLIGSGYEVRDLAYANIGHVQPNHQNYFAIGAAVNPEGSRAYVLAYDSTDLPNPTPQTLPRVYVFDLSNPVGAGQRMPLLGYFTVADYPTCRVFSGCLRPSITLAPDGNTLFIAGSENLLVVPVPAENTLTAANKIRPAIESPMVTTPWRVRTRPD
jgi:hypothetical protein